MSQDSPQLVRVSVVDHELVGLGVEAMLRPRADRVRTVRLAPGRAHPREAEVITLVTSGLSNTEIADRTYLSINSVKSYLRSACRAMGGLDPQPGGAVGHRPRHGADAHAHRPATCELRAGGVRRLRPGRSGSTGSVHP